MIRLQNASCKFPHGVLQELLLGTALCYNACKGVRVGRKMDNVSETFDRTSLEHDLDGQCARRPARSSKLILRALAGVLPTVPY